jgi:DUF4097 and DUF4098 domain-containing protein YvlB
MRLTLFAATAASLLLIAASDAAAQPQPPLPPPPPAPPLRLARLYQGRRAAEQSDRLSRRIRLGRDGRVSISNISGDIVVSAGGGDEVAIDAVKHGDRGSLDRVRIVIDDRPGRVDISTESDTVFRNNNNVSVDYTVTVPDNAALDLKSISGNVKVSGVKGSVRAQSISGNVSTSNAPRVEWARTVSGNVDLAGVSHDGDLELQSISGGVHVTGVKARSLNANTVSGDIRLASASIERVNARSVSGGFEYSGTLARNGRYEVTSHSGDVRFTLSDSVGFELNASSFSGSVRSDYAGSTTVGGGRRGRGFRRESTVESTVGDGSAKLELRTFSGSIVISRR